MKFIDSIEIEVRAGRGGDGVVSFMRAKYMPRMGPDGGDGGKGGSVILQGSSRLNTLSALRYNAIFKAVVTMPVSFTVEACQPTIAREKQSITKAT